MANIKFTNFARTQLAVGINAGDLTMSVVGGTGALFPSLSAGQYFYVTLENASLVREIVKVTARMTDTFTIVRAQDNTTALAWTTADSVSLRFNAAAIDDVLGSAAQNTAATGSLILASGTTAQRDVTPSGGYFRYNVTLTQGEMYLNTDWRKMYTSNDAVALYDVNNTFTLPQYGTKATDNDLSFDIGAAGKLFFDCTPTAGGVLTFTNIPASPCWVTIKLVNGANYAITAHTNTKVTSNFLATIGTTGTYIISGYCDGTNVHVATAGASA